MEDAKKNKKKQYFHQFPSVSLTYSVYISSSLGPSIVQIIKIGEGK